MYYYSNLDKNESNIIWLFYILRKQRWIEVHSNLSPFSKSKLIQADIPDSASHEPSMILETLTFHLRSWFLVTRTDHPDSDDKFKSGITGKMRAESANEPASDRHRLSSSQAQGQGQAGSDPSRTQQVKILAWFVRFFKSWEKSCDMTWHWLYLIQSVMGPESLNH